MTYNELVTWAKDLTSKTPGGMLIVNSDTAPVLHEAYTTLSDAELQSFLNMPGMSLARSYIGTLNPDDATRAQEEDARKQALLDAARQNVAERKAKKGSTIDRVGQVVDRMVENQERIKKAKQLTASVTGTSGAAPQLPSADLPPLPPPAIEGSSIQTTPTAPLLEELTQPGKKVKFREVGPFDHFEETPSSTFTVRKTGKAGTTGSGTVGSTISTTRQPPAPTVTEEGLLQELRNKELLRRITTPEAQQAVREATFPTAAQWKRDAIKMYTQGELDDARRIQRALDVVSPTTGTPKTSPLWRPTVQDAVRRSVFGDPNGNPTTRSMLENIAREQRAKTLREAGQFSLGQSQIPNSIFESAADRPKRPTGYDPTSLGGGALTPAQPSFEDMLKGKKRAPGTSTAGPSATGAPKGVPKGATPLGNMDELGAWFKKAATKANPQFSAKSGLKLFGAPLGMIGGGVNAIAQGVGAVDNLKKFNDTKSHTRDLQNDIMVAAMNNPMSTYGLTPDQIRLLGEVRRGKLKGEADVGSFDIGNALKEALIGGGIGLAGGLPMAAVGALAGGVKGGLTGLTEDQERQNAQLEALYHALNQSNARYNAARNEAIMKRYF